jgi:hypothetical protein
LTTDKDSGVEEEMNQGSHTSKASLKSKKSIDTNSLSSTPKSLAKNPTDGRPSNKTVNAFSSKPKISEKKLIFKKDEKPSMAHGNVLNISSSPQGLKESQEGKSTKPQNYLTLLSALENNYTVFNKDLIGFAFAKIVGFTSQEFCIRLQRIKKEMNELLGLGDNVIVENYNFLLKFLDNSADTINIKIKSLGVDFDTNNDTEELQGNLNLSVLSDEGLMDHYYIKNNSVAFEIPIKRKRAMSENDEQDEAPVNRLESRLANRKRLSSEEINRRIQTKLQLAEKNKHLMKAQYQENMDKWMRKMKNIKSMKKIEKQEKMQKLSDKLEKFDMRHKQYLNERISKAKYEQDKVAEINFLRRMEKENKDLSIIKKLDISIERRQNYINQRLSKTMQRNLKEEEVERKRKLDEEEYRNKIIRKLEKTYQKKEEDSLFTVNDKLELVNKRRGKIEEKIEFLKSVYSENFIWELLQADYFNLDDLCELSKLTKFELLKAKLKKDKDIIDKLYDGKNKSKTKITTTETITSGHDDKTEIDEGNDSFADSEKEDVPKRSRSFTIFDENDLMEVDYLFIDTAKKRKRKKKKKPEHIKNRLIRTINSMSQKDLTKFFTKMNTDKEIKRFLIRKKNGRYIKSRIIITNEQNLNRDIPPFNVEKDIVTSLTEGLADVEGDISFLDEKKEKIIKMVQTSDLNKNEGTILINSESLSNILEKNSITVKWCKLCNVIIPNDQDANIHFSKQEHKKIKSEYNLSLQDDSNFIMVFQSFPGDISEELKAERINAIKLRFKKVKQKLSLRAVKHENFWSYKQDFPSNNKQRIQKISFDIEKQGTNIKDYDSLESGLKDLIKILEQKKQNDLHIMRQVKIVSCLVEILKKPAVCHKSEIKNLGKIIELIIKVLMYFSSIIENRNYMIVTNRLSTIVDLLLWVLNKPSKIPLGISFLPDLIYIITIHIKHRIPFEHLSMKDDLLEYIFLSNILLKFRQKYTSMVGPIDLTSGFGSFPLVLLKSLGLIEALTFQINIK